MTIFKIISSAKWLLSGNFIYAASQWLLLVILAKLGTPEMVGQFTLALSIAAPVYMFTNLQLRPIQVADANEIYKFSDYYGLRLIGVIVAVVLIVILANELNPGISVVIAVVAAMKGVEAVADIIHGALNAKNNTVRIAKSLMIKGVASVIVFTIAIGVTKDIVVGVSSLAVTWFAVLVIYDFNGIGYNKCLRLEYNWRAFGALAKKAYPLGIAVMLVSLQANIPRYFLEKFSGTAAVGIYSALAYILIIGGVFINSLGQSISPQLASYWVSNDVVNFKRIANRTAIIAGALGFLSVGMVFFLGKWFLLTFYGEEYAQWNNALLIVMVSGAFLYMASVFGYAMTAANALKPQVPMFIAVAFGAFAASWFLIPAYGIIGAALASLITALLQLTISYFIFRSRVR